MNITQKMLDALKEQIATLNTKAFPLKKEQLEKLLLECENYNKVLLNEEIDLNKIRIILANMKRQKAISMIAESKIGSFLYWECQHNGSRTWKDFYNNYKNQKDIQLSGNPAPIGNITLKKFLILLEKLGLPKIPEGFGKYT